jgi:hypothetical protein
VKPAIDLLNSKFFVLTVINGLFYVPVVPVSLTLAAFVRIAANVILKRIPRHCQNSFRNKSVREI